MRHLKSGSKLSRTSAHRKLMFRNMAISLITHQIIKTTLPKARECRRIVEPLITFSKVDSISNRRLVFSKIRNNDVVAKLFITIGPHFFNRSGGYIRILKCGFRKGDNAPMAYVELVGRDKIKQDIDRYKKR